MAATPPPLPPRAFDLTTEERALYTPIIQELNEWLTRDWPIARVKPDLPLWDGVMHGDYVSFQPNSTKAFEHEPWQTAARNFHDRLFQRFGPSGHQALLYILFFPMLADAACVVTREMRFEQKNTPQIQLYVKEFAASTLLRRVAAFFVQEGVSQPSKAKFIELLLRRLKHSFAYPGGNAADKIACQIFIEDKEREPRLGSCLAMLTICPDEPEILDFIEKIISDEAGQRKNYMAWMLANPAQAEIYQQGKYSPFLFHDYMDIDTYLFQPLYRHGRLSRELMRTMFLECVPLSAPFAPIQDESYPEDFLTEMRGYLNWFREEASSIADEAHLTALARMGIAYRYDDRTAPRSFFDTRSLEGARFVVRAAVAIERLGIKRIRDPKSTVPARTVETGLFVMAHVPKWAPGDDPDQLTEELKRFKPDTLKLILPISGLAEKSVLKALGWEPVADLLNLLREQEYGPTSVPNSPDPTAGRIQIGRLDSLVQNLGAPVIKEVLDLLKASNSTLVKAGELVAAYMDWNRPWVEKGVEKRYQLAIKCYGLLPILRGEEEMRERFETLHGFFKDRKKFGSQRQASEKAAFIVALDHLAQRAGLPNATLLEWRLAPSLSTVPAPIQESPYELALSLADLPPRLTAFKAGKPLASIPAALKKHARFEELKDAAEQAKEHFKSFRQGMEDMMISGTRIRGADVLAVTRLPFVRELMTRLVFTARDAMGHSPQIGWLDLSALEEGRLVLACGERKHPLSSEHLLGPSHPFEMLGHGMLAELQKECVHRRIRQPFKQVFREVYVLTPAEKEAGDRSARFANRKLAGSKGARLLHSREWVTPSEDLPHKFFPAAGWTAVWIFREMGVHFFGEDDLVSDEIYFTRRHSTDEPEPLEEVPPAIFSEALRDADLVTSLAGTGTDLSGATLSARSEVVMALAHEMQLPLNIVDSYAVIQGKLATYRVHLGSATIHVEPGGHLCVVPVGEKELSTTWLPYVDDNDSQFAEVISKILMLSADDRISDRSIIDQIKRLVGT